MMLSAIVALSLNRVIGKDNKLPWRLPADLRYFKQKTLGKSILMGRKTYQSIGKPLPQRKNIIITHDKNFKAEGSLVVNSLDVALALCKGEDEVFIIGGASLFEQTLNFCDRLYLTLIHEEFAGDTFFPEINKNDWQEISNKKYFADAENAYDYSFIVLERKR